MDGISTVELLRKASVAIGVHCRWVPAERTWEIRRHDGALIAVHPRAETALLRLLQWLHAERRGALSGCTCQDCANARTAAANQ